MTDWILQALGMDAGDVDGLAGWSVRWETAQWGVLAAVLMGILAVLSWWLYRRSPQGVSGVRRFFLTALRLSFLALLLAILLQPVLVLTLEREVPRTLPILLDRSGSMALEDGDGMSRLRRAEQALTTPEGSAMLRSLEKDLQLPRFTFGTDSLQEWDDSSEPLLPEGDRTALGEIVRKTMERYRGSPLAGVLLITDGGQNSGSPLGEAVRQMKDAGIPVYAVGVGDPAARDVAIEGVEMREVLLADDAAPVTVKLRTQGMKGERGRVLFSLGGVDVAEEEVEIGEDGLQEVSTLFVP